MEIIAPAQAYPRHAHYKSAKTPSSARHPSSHLHDAARDAAHCRHRVSVRLLVARWVARPDPNEAPRPRQDGAGDVYGGHRDERTQRILRCDAYERCILTVEEEAAASARRRGGGVEVEPEGCRGRSRGRGREERVARYDSP
jgi:hypothetical protein